MRVNGTASRYNASPCFLERTNTNTHKVISMYALVYDSRKCGRSNLQVDIVRAWDGGVDNTLQTSKAIDQIVKMGGDGADKVGIDLIILFHLRNVQTNPEHDFQRQRHISIRLVGQILIAHIPPKR